MEKKRYFVGLDVGLKQTAICVVDAFGEQQLAAMVATDVAVIEQKLEQLMLPQESIQLGLETGQLSIYLSKALRAKGWSLVCMDARQVATALSTVVNKTDANDARGIAHLLRCGLYREVHVKSDDACDKRILLGSRKQLMMQVGSLESTLRGLLKIYGVVLGPARRSSYWLEHETYPLNDLAVIFHHRLVKIHLFPNGNGRHARMCADAIIAKYGGEKLSWGGSSNFTKHDDIRKRYIAALREADSGNYELLLKFTKS